MLPRAGVNAELHVFGKGSRGFDLGMGRGKSAEIWPRSFVAWLSDSDVYSGQCLAGVMKLEISWFDKYLKK